MLRVGDDWAEDHHDVELMDPTGRKLAAARLPEGVAGIAALHELIGRHVGEDTDAADVLIGIETDRGLWAQALIAAGYHRAAAPRPRSRRPGNAYTSLSCAVATKTFPFCVRALR